MATTTISALPAQTVLEPDNLLVVQDGVDTKKMAISVVTDATTASLNAHVTNTSGAHAASAIAATASGGTMVGGNVQIQLGQAASELATKVVNGGGVTTIRAMSQAGYDALPIKDPSTFYLIV